MIIHWIGKLQYDKKNPKPKKSLWRDLHPLSLFKKAWGKYFQCCFASLQQHDRKTRIIKPQCDKKNPKLKTHNSKPKKSLWR